MGRVRVSLRVKSDTKRTLLASGCRPVAVLAVLSEVLMHRTIAAIRGEEEIFRINGS